MATLTLHQVRTNEGPDGYKIFSEVPTALGIPKEIFVFDSSNDKFDHVAVPLDFYWPSVKDVMKPYYRQASCTKFFESVNLAIEYVDHTKRRVDSLVKLMTDEAVAFPGEDTVNYPTP